jgi:hypothetical protein
VSLLKNDTIVPGDVIHLDSNTVCRLDVISLERREAKANIIDVSNTGFMDLGAPQGQIVVGDTVFQRDASNEISGSALVTRTSSLSLTGGTISISGLQGVFRPNEAIQVEGRSSNALFKNITLNAAIVNSSNAFIDVFSPTIHSANNGSRAFVAGVTSGSNAQYRIATLKDSETVRVNTDVLANNIMLDTPLNSLAYGLAGNTAANASSIILKALNFIDLTIGSVATLGDLNPGSGYNRDPITSVYQPYITGYQARDYIFTVSNNQSQFIIGEYITQVANVATVRVSVSNAEPYTLGEKVYIGNTTVNFIANGIITVKNTTSKFIDLEQTTGTFPVSNTYTVKSLISSANSFVTNAVPFVAQYTSRGVVKDVVNDKVYVKRIQLANRFATDVNVDGSLSGANAVLDSIDTDVSTPPAGINASVRTKATTANGVIRSVQIIDSGYGFSNDSEIQFVANTDSARTGTASNIRGGVGVGTGYYRTAKGLLSDISRVHDGDYYQEYSYDIISRIPLEKYSTMFKKVMHTAGTRFFGSVLIDSLASTTVTVANSQIVVGDESPYNVLDRTLIDVQDRNDFFIQIRE